MPTTAALSLMLIRPDDLQPHSGCVESSILSTLYGIAGISAIRCWVPMIECLPVRADESRQPEAESADEMVSRSARAGAFGRRALQLRLPQQNEEQAMTVPTLTRMSPDKLAGLRLAKKEPFIRQVGRIGTMGLALCAALLVTGPVAAEEGRGEAMKEAEVQIAPSPVRMNPDKLAGVDLPAE